MSHFETIGSVHEFYEKLHETNGATLEGMGHLDYEEHRKRLNKAIQFSGWGGVEESVLDIGCGIGMLLRELYCQPGIIYFSTLKYTGIDLFQPFIFEAREQYQIPGSNKTFIYGDWGLASKVIPNHDHVFALGVVNFRPNHVARRLLEAMWAKANKSLTFTFHNHAPFDIEHFNPYHFFYEDVGGYTISFYMNAAGLEECMVSVHKVEDEDEEDTPDTPTEKATAPGGRCPGCGGRLAEYRAVPEFDVCEKCGAEWPVDPPPDCTTCNGQRRIADPPGNSFGMGIPCPDCKEERGEATDED